MQCNPMHVRLSGLDHQNSLLKGMRAELTEDRKPGIEGGKGGGYLF